MNNPYAIIRNVTDKYFSAMEAAGGNALSAPIDLIPQSLLDSERASGEDGYAHWKPVPSTVTDKEIAGLEAMFKHPLPGSYIFFLKYLHFVEFYLDNNQLGFFPNFPGQLVSGTADIVQTYYAGLPGRNFLPLANYGDWGVLCFDANAAAHDHEYPVVLFDQDDNYKEMEPYAANFVDVFQNNAAEIDEWTEHTHPHH